MLTLHLSIFLAFLTIAVDSRPAKIGRTDVIEGPKKVFRPDDVKASRNGIFLTSGEWSVANPDVYRDLVPRTILELGPIGRDNAWTLRFPPYFAVQETSAAVPEQSPTPDHPSLNLVPTDGIRSPLPEKSTILNNKVRQQQQPTVIVTASAGRELREQQQQINAPFPVDINPVPSVVVEAAASNQSPERPSQEIQVAAASSFPTSLLFPRLEVGGWVPIRVPN